MDSFLTDEIWRWHITIFYHRRDNGHYWTVFSLYFITDEIWRWYFHYILSRTRFGSAKSRQKFQTIFAIYIAIKLTDITARPICILLSLRHIFIPPLVFLFFSSPYYIWLSFNMFQHILTPPLLFLLFYLHIRFCLVLIYSDIF